MPDLFIALLNKCLRRIKAHALSGHMFLRITMITIPGQFCFFFFIQREKRKINTTPICHMDMAIGVLLPG
jgi:hypothetical protein